MTKSWCRLGLPAGESIAPLQRNNTNTQSKLVSSPKRWLLTAGNPFLHLTCDMASQVPVPDPGCPSLVHGGRAVSLPQEQGHTCIQHGDELLAVESGNYCYQATFVF